ncbi:GNAT family N-acetyltransferase [Azorhizobium sp. AG788]|uniref:GNAT family N-acetyltransferase n=1 Tax=Azorhizobium sp. AG788 TaxID=2183897 RepID=UPI0031390202
MTAIAQAAYGIYVPRIGRPPLPMLADYADLAENGLAQVLDIDGAVAGFLVLIHEPDALLLDNIAVSPDFQKRGLGRLLLSFADEAARTAGYSTVRLYTNAAMTENIALYGRCGYVETHRATEDGRHRVYMQKPV